MVSKVRAVMGSVRPVWPSFARVRRSAYAVAILSAAASPIMGWIFALAYWMYFLMKSVESRGAPSSSSSAQVAERASRDTYICAACATPLCASAIPTIAGAADLLRVPCMRSTCLEISRSWSA